MIDTKCPRCDAECPQIEDAPGIGPVYECCFCANPVRFEGWELVPNRGSKRVNFTWAYTESGIKRPIAPE